MAKPEKMGPRKVKKDTEKLPKQGRRDSGRTIAGKRKRG